MPHSTTCLAIIAAGTLAASFAAPASAQLLQRKDLSLTVAQTIANGALEACKAMGYAASVVVVDRAGETLVSLRGDGSGPHTVENARRKAYTAARSAATSTRALAEKVQGSPTELSSFDPGFSFFHGGVAAFSDGRRVGAVGVSGLPGAEDERLAVAAIAAAGLEARI